MCVLPVLIVYKQKTPRMWGLRISYFKLEIKLELHAEVFFWQ